jgi:RNA polymerase sigma-70 factor, ECF subfamily
MARSATDIRGPAVEAAAGAEPRAAAPAVGADPLRALFDRARAGDGPALDELCATMRPRLYRAAWAILRDADEADDVAQEALIRALARRFLFLGRGSVGGWMTRIAINLAKNRLRDVRRRREIVEAEPPRAPASGPEVAFAEAEERARLLAAVEALPERQRDVVRLHVVAQLDFPEIAEALGITASNARMTFSHAKKKLVAALGEPARPEVTGGAP